MAKTFVQKVVFKNATAKDLYELYMNPKKHSMITGGPAKISEKIGGKFSAHGGYITGRNLQLTKNKLIVQSWRAEGWDKNQVDSTFIIHLEPKGKDCVVHAIHANVPDASVAGLKKGWFDHYWEPWKAHLSGKPVIAPKM